MPIRAIVIVAVLPQHTVYMSPVAEVLALQLHCDAIHRREGHHHRDRLRTPWAIHVGPRWPSVPEPTGLEGVGRVAERRLGRRGIARALPDDELHPLQATHARLIEKHVAQPAASMVRRERHPVAEEAECHAAISYGRPEEALEYRPSGRPRAALRLRGDLRAILPNGLWVILMLVDELMTCGTQVFRSGNAEAPGQQLLILLRGHSSMC
mmetsp:Transcript_99907/g.213911  ORF Transcript_99907/g.213911 Transcript_99907/m.213911 type:complete len:210 (+) Transcript_99907:591-1220(+)